MKINVEVTKQHLIFFILIFVAVSFGIYKYNTMPFEPVEAFDFSAMVNDKQADEYLEAILLANKSAGVKNNISFQKLVDTLNLSVLDDYSKKLKLSNEESKKLVEAYYDSRSTIIEGIHTTMISNHHYNQKRETTYEYLNSLNGFAESFSGFACSVASFSFLSSLPKITNNSFVKYIAIKPTCAEILTKVVNPATSYLRDKAIVRDMNIVTLSLQKRVKASIFKLASAQTTLTFELENVEKRDYDPFGSTEFLGLGKIEWSKYSKLNAYVKAIVIAGFDMSSYEMNVEHQTRTLSIHLRNPSIISNNVNVYFRKANNEWGSPKIDSNTYNKIGERAKDEALYEAKKSDLFNDAKKSAYISIMNIFEPLMELPQFNYKVRVYFDNNYYNGSAE
jgi:hypothetical protein